MSIQPKDARKNVCDQACAIKESESFKEAQEATRKQLMEQHWWNVITHWTNETDPNASNASTTHLRLPIIGFVCQETLDSWTSQLVEQGYVVTTNRNIYTISLGQ